MSAYLKYFELEQSPFEGRASTRVVLGTPALRDALASIEAGLEEGAARICVSGGPGLGKTSLARALPQLLGESARVAIVADPNISWESVRGSIAKQWELDNGGLARARLIAAARQHRLVIVIDQAERASEEFLDHLDVVLSYRSENDEQVVQSVLFADLSQAGRGDEPVPLVWWLDRIQTRQLEFAPLPRDGVVSYIHRHLKRAGWRGDHLFTQEAAWAIHGYSGGVPGEVSSLCERLLTEAAARGLREIPAEFVHSICDENAEEDAEEDAFWSLDDALEELALEEAATADTHESDVSNGPIRLKEASSEGGEFAAGFGVQDDPGAAREEAADAGAPAVPLPTFAEALEHFEGRPHDDDDRVSGYGEPIGSNCDAPLISLEDALSTPPAREAWRTILGHFLHRVFRRHGKAIAAAALMAALGGLALSWIGGRGGSTSDGPAIDVGRESREANPTDTRPRSSTPDDPLVLARIRGPVVPSATDREPDESTADAPDEGLDEAGDEEIIDLRPASMIPDSAEDPETERFW